MNKYKKPLYVSNKEVQAKFNVTSKTIRRWAKENNWTTLRVNCRVLRYKVEDIEKTAGCEIFVN